MSDISARYGRASVPRGFTYVTTNNLPRVKGHRRPQSVGPEPHGSDYYLGSRLKWTTMPSTDYGAYEDSYTGFSSLGFRPHYRSTRNERIRAVDDAYRGLNRFEPPRLDPVPAIPKRRAYETPRYEPWIPASYTYSDYPLGTNYYLGRKRALDLGDEIANLYERNFRNRRYLHSQDTINDSKYALHKLRTGNLNYYPYLLPSRSGLGRDYVPETTYQPSTSAFPYTYLRSRPLPFLEPIDWSRFTPRPVDFVPNRYLFVPIRVPRGSRGRRAASVAPGSNYMSYDDGRRARSVSRVRSPQRDVGHNIRAKALLDHTTPNYYHTHGYRPGQLPLDPDYPLGNRSSSVPRPSTGPTRTTPTFTPTKRYDTAMPDTGRASRPRTTGYEPSDTGRRKPSSYEPSSTDRPSRRTEPSSAAPATPSSANEPYRRPAPVAEDDNDRASRGGRKPTRDTEPTDTGRGGRGRPAYEEPAPTGRGVAAKPAADDDTPYVSRRHPTAAGEAETPSPDMALGRQKAKPTGDEDDEAAAGSPTGGPAGAGGPRGSTGVRPVRDQDNDAAAGPAGGAGAGEPRGPTGGVGGRPARDEDEDGGRPPTRTPPPSAADDEDAEPYASPAGGDDVDAHGAVLADRRASRKPVPAGHGLLFDPDAEDDAGAPGAGAAEPAAGDEDTEAQPEDDAAAAAAAEGEPGAAGGARAPGAGAGKGPADDTGADAGPDAGRSSGAGAGARPAAGKSAEPAGRGGRPGAGGAPDEDAVATPTDRDNGKVGSAQSREYRSETREEQRETAYERKDYTAAGTKSAVAKSAGSATRKATANENEDDELRRGQEEEEMIVEESPDDNASRRRPGDYDERAIAKRSRTDEDQVTEKKDYTEEYEYEVRRETTAYEITETWEEQIEHAGYEEIVEAGGEGEYDGQFVEEEDDDEKTPVAQTITSTAQPEAEEEEQPEEEQQPEEDAAPADEEQVDQEEPAEEDQVEVTAGDEEEELAPEEGEGEEELAAEEEEE